MQESNINYDCLQMLLNFNKHAIAFATFLHLNCAYIYLQKFVNLINDIKHQLLFVYYLLYEFDLMIILKLYVHLLL